MVRSHLEVERKYDLDRARPLPDLTEAVGVAVMEPVAPVTLEAVYVDTADLRLARRGITLRRRTGGPDEGWHLKLPRGTGRRAARLELASPLSSSSDVTAPPAELLDHVRVITRDAALVPVAVLTTRRTVHRLRDVNGRPVAEVADDDVRAVVPPRAGRDGDEDTWREVEVELTDGDADGDGVILDRAEAVLLGAGATPSASGSKLGRALGGDAVTVAGPELPRLGRRSNAREAVVAYLAEQRDVLVALDPEVRVGLDGARGVEAVHLMRVAIRRTRSVLTTYGSLWRPGTTDDLVEHLGVVGSRLGAVRDAQVLGEKLLAVVDDLLPDPAAEAARRRIERTLADRSTQARADLGSALRSADYFRALDDLDALIDGEGIRPRAGRAARRVLPPMVRREWLRVAARHDLAAATTDVRDADLARHRERKAAKRARYAAEVLAPVAGRDAERFARRMTAIQQSLGDRQDTVVARAFVDDVTTAARADGEDTFVYGVVHGWERAAAATALREHRSAWTDANRRSVLRWLG